MAMLVKDVGGYGVQDAGGGGSGVCRVFGVFSLSRLRVFVVLLGCSGLLMSVSIVYGC